MLHYLNIYTGTCSYTLKFNIYNIIFVILGPGPVQGVGLGIADLALGATRGLEAAQEEAVQGLVRLIKRVAVALAIATSAPGLGLDLAAGRTLKRTVVQGGKINKLLDVIIISV